MKNIFKSIANSGTLTSRVREEVADAIRSGKLKSGDRLPKISEITEMFGVSQTVVREALLSLEAMGMLIIKRRGGIHVATPSPDWGSREISAYVNLTWDEKKYQDVFELRLSMEPDVAHYAALRRTEKQLKNLEDLVEQFQPERNEKVLMVDLDRMFHLQIAEMCQNESLIITLNTYLPPMYEKMGPMYPHLGFERTADQHRAIYEAIRDQNEDAAKQNMREHLDDARQHAIGWDK
jgi:GntR family transcriptional regulator, transcriptional repressor for pyruvate dehydrogenase complex